ncbi:hypothetical protein FKM82_025153 [Ascaphus truei]
MQYLYTWAARGLELSTLHDTLPASNVCVFIEEVTDKGNDAEGDAVDISPSQRDFTAETGLPHSHRLSMQQRTMGDELLSF